MNIRHTLVSALTAAAVLAVTALVAQPAGSEPRPLDRVVAALRGAA